MTPGDMEVADDLVSPGEDRDLQSLSSFLQCVSTSTSTSPKNSRSPSPALSLPTLSPGYRRRRLFNIRVSPRNAECPTLGGSPPVRNVLRLAKDHFQPSSGSISEVHSEASIDEEDEEVDFFNLDSNPMRPRARTCPEHRSWLRKVRARNMRRPPTPPPGGTDSLEVEKQFSKLLIRDKLRIPTRDLPGVPENTGRILGDLTLDTDIDT